ncbi:gastric triacylglycerol lipase [Procambarus clarkii]|uniref:gastric triacylglycerol lipase n=1 Tax=Procambarus clarkii TaxID=6728 RepID=UPI001E6717F8|nr:gastric triacylglycerol lipase-like [Procambarus clarkii]XP_045615975.1 gastric triacylglycerol lipase-like [Procambarus clarkii]
MMRVVRMVMLAGVMVAGVMSMPSRAPRQSLISEILTRLISSGSPTLHPHVQDTGSLGREAGYLVESHTVTTEDGYLLTLHHLPPYANPSRRRYLHLRESETDPPVRARWNASDSGEGPALSPATDTGETEVPTTPRYMDQHASNSSSSGKVVFLQHGLMGSSDNWNTNTKQDSLAYLLSDAGYDVWMGNFRGNIYSRRHMNLTHKDPRFWKFSYDEMARYDLPAMLDYVLEETGARRLHYLGHSMGTTVFFALMSSQPEYQQRVASMVALAPVATVTNIVSPIKYLAPLVNELQLVLRLLGNDQELMTNRLLISLWEPYRVCGSHAFCENLQFLITGFDPSRADQEMVPVILSHNPAGASTQTLFHFAQGFTSGRFQHFDWGRESNLERYGQVEPPVYNVTNINVPITMFWSLNDWLIGEKDVHRLEEELPHVEACYKVSNPIFSHLDFLWATDARSLVYEKVFDILDEAINKY